VTGQAPPPIEPRSYAELRDAALARIPVHNPEWTNFTASDPGVTLLELFAFLTESLAYRANRIPERNRRRFLELLRVPLTRAASARGVITIDNPRGQGDVVPLAADVEVRAGAVPFRTELGLDVLPVEGRPFVKEPLAAPPPELVDHYRALYASYAGRKPALVLDELRLYRTVPLDPGSVQGTALEDTADGCVWIAILLPEGVPPSPAAVTSARRAIAGRVLNLGVVPAVPGSERRLDPVGIAAVDRGRTLAFEVPRVPDGGLLPAAAADRRPTYRALAATPTADVTAEPGIVQLTLPADEGGLTLWTDLEPLEDGVGDFPPSLEDTRLVDRLVTWVRIRAGAGVRARFIWVGTNATMVSQRARVVAEALPDGTGEPDQAAVLARTPVIPESVRVTVTAGGRTDEWELIDDLLAAGPEVPVEDVRRPPGTAAPPPRPSRVATLDAATGDLRFGDGARGARPALGAIVRAAYDYGAGAAGNVGPGSIADAPSLPGFVVSNPVRTWGGADAETLEEGEKQAARFLRNRDRAVTVDDYEAVVWRTPGIDLGRVDVIPAFNPDLAPSSPGSAPGAVTLMVIPRLDPRSPVAPTPDARFLDAICRWVGPRRLVTTEVHVRGPVYRDVWVSAGIDVVPGEGEAAVAEAVRAAVMRFLAPVDPDAPPWWQDEPPPPTAPWTHPERGWPRERAVERAELVAVASRVPGVRLVRSILVAEGDAEPAESIPFTGLELPFPRGVAVAVGDAPSLAVVRGSGPGGAPAPQRSVPVPVVPERC
jgi:hypothetical protein